MPIAKASSTGEANAPVHACPAGDDTDVPSTSGVAVVVLRNAMPKMCRPGSASVTAVDPLPATWALTAAPTSGRSTEVTVQDAFTGTANA